MALDDLVGWLDGAVDGGGDPSDAADHALMAPPDHASAMIDPHHPVDHGGAAHLDGLVLPPGCDGHAHYMALPDPLSGMSGYGFEGFSLGPQHGLIDTDGDGVPDHTCWGTPVIEVEPYVRADGTLVEGHFRTVPDGLAWNNLSRDG